MPPLIVRRLVLAVALLLLLAAVWTGFNGISLLSASQSTGQKVQAAAQIAFGLFALLGLVTTFTARRVQPVVLACFALTLCIASGLFVVVWNRSSVLVGVLTGAMAFLVAGAIIWMLRRGLVI